MQETTDKSLLADTYEQATIRIQETKKALDEAILNSYHAQEAAKTRDVILYHLSELREQAEWGVPNNEQGFVPVAEIELRHFKIYTNVERRTKS